MNEPTDWRGIPLRRPDGAQNHSLDVMEYFWTNGKRRPNMLHVIMYLHTDGSWFVRHYKNGSGHGENGPAYFSSFGHGEQWMRKGAEHVPSAHEMMAWKERISVGERDGSPIVDAILRENLDDVPRLRCVRETMR